MPDVVDIDFKETWPTPIRDRLIEVGEVLLREQQEELVHMTSDDKLHKPWPSMAVTKDVTEFINSIMADKSIRVFHATRLIDPEALKREGLKPLILAEKIKWLESVFSQQGNIQYKEVFLKGLAGLDVEGDFSKYRDGSVWFTPLRYALHDGGCDVFFEHCGGEGVQRLASCVAADTKEPAILEIVRNLGSPYVVVANIPAFGWCEYSETQLARTLIDARLAEMQGDIHDYRSWDVMLKRAVPSENIELVIPSTDAYLRP